MAPEKEDKHYKPKDAIAELGLVTAISSSVGLFAAAVENATAKTHVGAWGVFTRSGGHIATFGAVGGVYAFSRAAAANLREKDDHWNEAIGGFLGGSILGLRTLRMPAVLGWGALTAVLLATFEYTGSSLRGFRPTQGFDEYERKEMMRKNRRRPIEETIAEVGEGRSIRPPGYEERRRERLKEKYGIDISTVSADPDAA